MQLLWSCQQGSSVWQERRSSQTSISWVSITASVSVRLGRAFLHSVLFFALVTTGCITTTFAEQSSVAANSEKEEYRGPLHDRKMLRFLGMMCKRKCMEDEVDDCDLGRLMGGFVASYIHSKQCLICRIRSIALPKRSSALTWKRRACWRSILITWSSQLTDMSDVREAHWWPSFNKLYATSLLHTCHGYPEASLWGKKASTD